ncbi:MAG: histidine phosphatase family protein [Bryobacteraceae bacterium]|nr:histidine phosphatase family protein [Bryobacteraceae bacterium]
MENSVYSASAATIHFETHATSLDNESGVASGHYDVALSPLGERQAAELGLRYATAPLAAVFCSDLQRSCRTAEIAFASRRAPVFQDARLRECDYGELTRHPVAEIDQQRTSRIHSPFPGGESYEQCLRRVAAFLAERKQPSFNGTTILVIGHRATWYALEHELAARPLEDVIAAPWRWQPGWTYRLHW